MYLSALRFVTIDKDRLEIYRMLLDDTVVFELMRKVINLMLNEVKSVTVMSECLWILTNLACEGNKATVLALDFQMLHNIEVMLSSYFLQPDTHVFQENLFE